MTWGFILYVAAGLTVGFGLTWLGLQALQLWAGWPLFNEPFSFVGPDTMWRAYVMGCGQGMILGALAAIHDVLWKQSS